VTGAIAAGFHEGSRSEYLAQYVFSKFGTSVPVPHQEDHGIDLFCCLTERKGQRAWPVAYYSVQVKSTGEPWLFEGADSVQWLLRYPAPLLLCIVDKSTARLLVYQLTARFQAAALTDLPPRLALVPGQPEDGRVRIGWDADGNLALGAPILDFTVSDFLDDERFALFSKILRFWVLNDMANLRRQQMGTRSASGPSMYVTNEMPPGGVGTYSMVLVPPDARTAAEETAADHLDWLARVMLTDGDRLGALLTALLLRHLIPSSDLRAPGKPAPEDLYMRLREGGRLDKAAGTEGVNYIAAPIDKLLAKLREACDGSAGGETA
jgi:hypothetical protein